MSVDIRTAILKAADWIECNPEQFNFDTIYIPPCGSPGCALGWIGHFMGLPQATHAECVSNRRASGDTLNLADVRAATGISDGQFYLFMNDIDIHWMRNSKICARGMRLYADKYHPKTLPAKPSGAEICREIISKPYKELACSP